MPKPALSFSLIGTRFFQPEINRCREGEPLAVLHEYDNPYDDRALIVRSARGQPIGYVSKGNFLNRALLDEQQECVAKIRKIVVKRGNSGILMEVTLFGRTGRPISRCAYDPKLIISRKPMTF